jgi:tetratricopeptide (TPR) repeat protein
MVKSFIEITNKKKVSITLFALFFLIVFIISLKPHFDFDIWFHLKSGEIISQMGIIFHDVFSYTSNGREWYPYEWLFQWFVYQYVRVFGFRAIEYLVAILATIQVVLVFLILRKIFKLHVVLTILTLFFYFSGVFEFFTGRPHLFAYTFLITNLFLILYYFFNGKNLLIFTVPITLLWSNIHGSIFLGVYFFLSYGFIALLNFRKTKEKIWKKKALMLGGFGVLTGVLSILPPLGFTQYRLLWRFFENREVITRFIDEWTPLGANLGGFILYSVTAAAVLVVLLIYIFRDKKFYHYLWILPLLPLVLSAYTANRNVFLGTLALAVLLGWVLSKLEYNKFTQKTKIALLVGAILFCGFSGWRLYEKSRPPNLYYPVQATQFIKNYQLKGNMFNEYAYGGYLLYQLYPTQKVFIDGRTDVYLCCEIKDLMSVSSKKAETDNEFGKVIYQTIYDKYQVSFVVLRTEKHSEQRKITRLLNQDPQWSLVYWDDVAQIFIRKDRKNDAVLNDFGSLYATPYLREPFLKDFENEALKEYLRMEKVAKSARTSNAVGFILLKKGRIEEAQKRFEEAISLYPNFESPYMNLAEILASRQDFQSAIKLYVTAQKIAPDRGMVYIRLGQLYIEGFNDVEKAKAIWQEGLENTVDEDAKMRLQKLLST